MHRILLSAALLCILALPAVAETITSTSTGGLWTQPSTWVGGVPPTVADDVVVLGPVQADFGATCSDITVKSILENAPSVGNGHIVIHGDLVNEGEIRNNSYGFTIALHGDLHNEGTIRNSFVEFKGEDVTHHLSGGPAGSIETSVFLPEFIASTLVATTPLQFYNGGIGLGSGSMILEPGADLTFVFHGGVGGSFGEGALYANGNSIRLDTYGAIGGGLVDQVVLSGHAALGADTRFTGGVTVADTLVNRAHNDIVAECEGLLLNEGLIMTDGGSFELRVLGDAENLGAWTNDRVVVVGEQDQGIGAGAGIDVPEFVLVANIDASGYQWTRDGVAIPGAMASTLDLGSVDADDYGVYRCEGDGGEISRSIAVAEFLDATDATPVAAGLSLAQNHPNPFNPATEFRFSLETAGPARLAVYDVRGREVAVLVDGMLTAGEHRVEWRAEDLGSGIYLYRLQAAGREQVRKATLLK